MSSTTILKCILNVICPIVLVVAHELIYKFTPYKKLNQWIRVAIISLIGAALVILSYYYGFVVTIDDNTNSILSLSLLVILAIGLLIDWRSGVIAGGIGIIYRFFMIPFNKSDIFRFPSTISMLIACGIILFIQLYASKNKKISWLYAFFIGLFSQTLQIFLIFLFGLENISAIYYASGLFDVFSVLSTGAAMLVMFIIVALINKESIKIRINTDKRLVARVQRRLFIATIVSFFAASFTSYFINFQKTSNDCNTTISSSVNAMRKQADNLSVITYIEQLANNQRIMTKGFFIITDSDSEIVSILEEGNLSKYRGYYFAIQEGYKSREIRDYESETIFECKWENTEYVCYYEVSTDTNYNIIGLVPTDEVSSTVGVSVRVVMYLLIIIFTLLFLLIDYIIRRLIVNNIYRINRSLRTITAGNLHEIVNVRDSAEFDQLSTDINLTVSALKDYASEINRRLKQDTKLAIDIQKNSVITSFPVENGFDVYGMMETASEAGGDFYDYIKLNNNKVAIIIADVIGSGIAATMYMIQAKTYLRSLFVAEEGKDIDLKVVFEKANKEFCKNVASNEGMAMWAGILNISTGELTFANANHIAPLIKQKDTYRVLECKENIYLGIDKNYEFKTENIKLEVNDELLLFTDGIARITDEDSATYGVDKLINRLMSINYFTSRQLIQQVNDDINHFLGDKDLTEDITMLSFRYTGIKDKRPEHEITLKAIPNNTPIATKFVESIMQQYNCSAKSQAIMLIAVDELFSNIAYYAYKGKPEGGNGTIRIEIKGQEFRMMLIDSGTPFNPLSHLDPNYINSSAEDRTNKGGLGIFMVRRSVDDMQYKYENNQNILTIIKNIPEMHEEEFKDSYSTTRD